PPAGYRAAWLRFDNATGATQPIGTTRSRTTTIEPPPGLLPAAIGSFVEIDLAAETEDRAAWQQPVRTYFRRTSEGWKLVGLAPLPESTADAAAATRSAQGGR